MPELNGCEFVIDQKYKIGLGFIDKEVHPVLQDFNSLMGFNSPPPGAK